jgi:hypothetical protein
MGSLPEWLAAAMRLVVELVVVYYSSIGLFCSHLKGGGLLEPK